MAEIKGRVGNALYNENEQVFGHRYNFQGAQLVQEMGGKYFEHLLRGEAFIYSTAATGVTGAAAATNTAPMIWNPAGSGKTFIPVRVFYGAISGTVIAAHVAFGIKTDCGSAIGTAAPIVSLTHVDPVNALIGSGRKSVMKFAPATVSLTGAPTYLMTPGLSAGGALAAGPLFSMVADLTEGCLAIPPGTAFFPYMSNGAIALVASVAVMGIEIPVSAM